MKPITRTVLLALAIICCATQAFAEDISLGSRKFKHLGLNVGEIPSDCRQFVTHGATLSYIHDSLDTLLGQSVDMANTNNAPLLMFSLDCLRLVDASERGDGRTIGFAVNLHFQFTRPFYEDIAYIFAAPWHKSTLLFIPYREFSQDYFNEFMDDSLAEFAMLWSKEHPAAVKIR